MLHTLGKVFNNKTVQGQEVVSGQMLRLLRQITLLHLLLQILTNKGNTHNQNRHTIKNSPNLKAENLNRVSCIQHLWKFRKLISLKSELIQESKRFFSF